MDREFVEHVHSGILLAYKRNTLEPLLMRWMNLGPIIQIEVSLKEKDKDQILNVYIKDLER